MSLQDYLKSWSGYAVRHIPDNPSRPYNTKSCFNTIVILRPPPAPADRLAFTIIYLPKRILV
jgi:hypothetical protein